MRKLFGTDGIRGLANSELTPELATKIGMGLVRVLKNEGMINPKVMVGMDTRISSPMLGAAVEAGIMSAGGDVCHLGVCSTPAVAYLMRLQDYQAGVMISASHNPHEYNGIKIFGGDGFKLNDRLEKEIEKQLFSDKSCCKTSERIGTILYAIDLINDYVDYIANAFKVDLTGMKVGIDCANGSASASAEGLFKRLGCQCTMLGNTPDGVNINKNCGSTHLDGLKRLVVEMGLDMGIAFDGDADRCLAVDENGNEVDGDHIMAILATELLKENKLNKNTVVGTVMSNLGFERFCTERGIDFVRTKVGDRYVLEAMSDGEFSFGGEQSGHVILRDYATTGDGQLTAVALLSCIKKSGKSLSTLAAVMKKYPQYSVNIEADFGAKSRITESDEIKEIIENAEKAMGGFGRILVRPSGTEPLVRVMVEGENEEVTRDLCNYVASRIRNILIK